MVNWCEIQRIMQDYMYYGYGFKFFLEQGYEICKVVTEEELRKFWNEVKNWMGDSCINTPPYQQRYYREERTI